MTCRICKSSNSVPVVDLGEQVITSRFPALGDTSTPRTPICLVLCRECGLVQLRDTVSGSEMYEHMYGYRSGLNEMMRKHLEEYNAELSSMAGLWPGDAVLDIGSNDGTFLSCYPPTLRRIGCDPTGKQFEEFYTDMKIVPTYFTRSVFPDTRFKAVSSISMFYDLPDPVQFARDVHAVLLDDGIWTLEQSYLGTMIEQNSIDTICHEHVEYYGLRQIKRIMDEAGFVIVRVSKNTCNGGSFRIYAAKAGFSAVECPEVAEWIAKEGYLSDPRTYERFVESCATEVSKLTSFLATHKTYVYGASTKGNCLLQYANITPDRVPYAVERNPLKFGKMTSTGIPIVSEEFMRENPPEALLVLPWHFREAIVQREANYLAQGGRLVFPFPSFEVVTLSRLETHL